MISPTTEPEVVALEIVEAFMFRFVKPVAIGAATAALVFGLVNGATAAFGSSSSSSGAPVLAQPAGSLTPAPDPTAGLQYVPLPACVMVATRQAGGILFDGEARSFNARGTGSFAGQGGSTHGCGVPLNAVSLSAILTATTPLHAGHIKVKPFGGAGTGALAVSYIPGLDASNSVNINLALPSAAKGFTLINIGGPTHAIVTVVGYYIGALRATVSPNGTLVSGSRVVATHRSAMGQYTVTFDRDVSKCTYAADPWESTALALAQPQFHAPNGVTVGVIRTADSAFLDAQFFLTVTC